MITIHWLTLYAIIAWTWSLTCWAYESSEGKHAMRFWESIGAVIAAPLYLWLALIILGVELLIEAWRRRF